MKSKRKAPFKIENIDSLGQGVSKIDGKIIFIEKTIPGEEGVCDIYSEKKGVAFGQLSKLSVLSKNRINPVCPHFQTCSSCHYLHMEYEQEIEHKKNNFHHLLRFINPKSILTIPAPKRLHYRNRIQLHYDLKLKKLGMLGGSQQEIVPVPNCLIGDELVQMEIKKLYNNSHWLTLVPDSPQVGHVEIYHRENQVKLSWNRPYADGGFSQVYSHMNSLLIEELGREWAQKEQFKLLDLFSGQGNLSHQLNFSRRLCVDSFPNEGNPDFFQQDLYDPKALHSIKKFLEKTQFDVDFLILDPPRSGFKNLKEWLGFINPKKVAYVSCNPHTLTRDIRHLDQYEVTKAVMLDFFPSTYHFESLIFMERKD